MNGKVYITCRRFYAAHPLEDLWADMGENTYVFSDLSYGVRVIEVWNSDQNGRYVYAIKRVEPAPSDAKCDTF